MAPLTLEQIRDATASESEGDPALLIHCICTDSREITPGCLFIALAGENHDGHDHLQTAADRGALAAMVHRPALSSNLPLIVVDDTRKAMGRLANFIRRQMKSTVIAVAGSNGKTGTKNLIHAALKGSLAGTISPKSFNNDVGVPTTIFAADPDDDYLVLEIGTNHPGEILNLTTIAQPDIAVITNIGAEHLEFLGDLPGVLRENAQIITGLNPHGLLVINGDSQDLPEPAEVTRPVRQLAKDANRQPSGTPPTTAPDPGAGSDELPSLLQSVGSYPGSIITFGIKEDNDLHAAEIRCQNDGVRFRLSPRTSALRNPAEPDCSRFESDLPKSSATGVRTAPEIFIPLMGRHTAVNALAAIAVARHLGVDDTAIFAGLAIATGPEMRLQLQNAGSVKILNDAYNANPHSMQAALETIRDMETTGRRVAVLGDMLELGNTADGYHSQAGHFAAQCRLDVLICVGEKAGLMAAAAVESGMRASDVLCFATVADCLKQIPAMIIPDDLVLLKASRGMKFESIAMALKAGSTERALRRVVAARTSDVIVPAAPIPQVIR